jgi:hypothetical protein
MRTTIKRRSKEENSFPKSIETLAGPQMLWMAIHLLADFEYLPAKTNPQDPTSSPKENL